MDIIKYGVLLTEQQHPYLVVEEKYEWDNTVFSSADCIDAFFRSCLSMDCFAEEYVYMVAFSAAMIPLGIFEISHGSVSNSFLCPREIFIRILLCGASNFVLLHNHPSGFTVPSKDDISVAQRISNISDLMGVKLVDFIILGKDYFSFHKEKML